MRLKDKVVFISGAGSGMGRLASQMFAQQGAKIVANDYNAQSLQETVDRVKAQGGDAIAEAGDVSKAADVERAIRAGVAHYGRLNVLYNNAGVSLDGDDSVLTLSDDIWDRTLDINLKGIGLCCKYGIAELLKAGGGSVINIASFVALVGCSVPQDAYTSSKGAVIALTQSLAVQFGPKGIRSNAICPGPILTPLLEKLYASDPAKRALRLNRIPMGRFGKAEDIVHAAMYLASDESTWVNGASLVVDGGITVNYF
ncbi:MAG: glucose 1-dehydrogenase [Chloroflexi bacterium]|nr:glucose 1-dehydrogenase [Chloroflexota bacterium]